MNYILNLREILAEETNINNINNINYNNNINDFNFNICSSETNELTKTPAVASDIASRPQLESVVPQEGIAALKLPPRWRGVKLDLFDNGTNKNTTPSLKLKVNVIKQDGTTQSLVANLNSPHRYTFRVVDPIDQVNFHWTCVKNYMLELKNNEIDFRISKCALPNKQGGTEAVVILMESDAQWVVHLINEGKIYEFLLDKLAGLNKNQRASNMIASKFFGQEMKRLYSLKELGL
jgi:hypothetical protein